MILVVALLLFGPRKLPQMARSLSKSLGEFKRAGDDFKRTWEREVALEGVEREAAIDRVMVADTPAGEAQAIPAGEQTAPPARDITEAAFAPVQGANVARGAHATTTDAATLTEETAAQQQPARKTDWL